MNAERIAVLLITVIIAYAILTPIFKQYWIWISIVLGLILVIFAYCMFQFATFRQAMLSAIKSLGTKFLGWLRTESQEQHPTLTVPQRTTVPKETRIQAFDRARHRCQFPHCRERANLEIHHIDKDPSNHKLANLIVLCKNHHAMAQKNAYRTEQLQRWAAGVYHRRREFYR